MMNASLKIVLTLLLVSELAVSVSAQTNPDANRCSLCPEGVAQVTNAEMVANDSCQTCGDIAIELAANRMDCNSGISTYRSRCCTSGAQPSVACTPQSPAEVGQDLPQGTEPWCDLCPDGRFPANDRVVTAVLYIPGNPTCGLLYKMGRKGLIEDRLCYPMQDYLGVDCGCFAAATNTGQGNGPFNGVSVNGNTVTSGQAAQNVVASASSSTATTSTLGRRSPNSNSNAKDSQYKIGGSSTSRGSTRRQLKGSAPADAPLSA